METLFDFADFAETRAVEIPPIMHPCGTHETLRGDADHLRDCWKGECPSCGESVLNDFLMRLNHTGAESGICVSVSLRLNHLTNAIRSKSKPGVDDLSVIDLGWRIAPDGTQIAPDGTVPNAWSHRWGNAEDWREWVSRSALVTA